MAAVLASTLVLFVLVVSAFAADQSATVTVDDVVSRTLIRSFSISPDGHEVAFLTTKAIPRQNIYEVTLYLQRTSEVEHPIKLAQYALTPEDVYDRRSQFLYKRISQYVWSRDSKRLLYTVHAEGGMDLRIVNSAGGEQKALLTGHEYVQIDEMLADQRGWKITTIDAGEEEQSRDLPKDFALLMKEGYRFDYPSSNPKLGRPVATESWEFDWGPEKVTNIAGSRVVAYRPYPDEYSWNGHSVEIRFGDPSAYGGPKLLDADKATSEKSGQSSNNAVVLDVDFQPEKTTLRVKSANETREVYEEAALLLCHYSEQTDQSRNTCLSQDGTLAILLRSTNLVPDELVRLDLVTGKMSPLFSPNGIFRQKTRGIRVRFMPIPGAGRKLHGRLFLPADYDGKSRYPLVFTTYLSTAGFNLGSGEVPILPLVANDIAVFALDARDANEVARQGDFETELRRVERPRKAMEWIVEELSREGVIDPKRVGMSGSSYGTEISMYVYWKSGIFRTVSATTGSWEPMLYWMGGLGLAGFLNDRGFQEPKDGAYAGWKKLSAGVNARPTLPPLLWQAPDDERQWCVESWFELRRSGAQVEWLEYPDEGHVKRSPANIWWVNQRNLDWFRFWLKDEEDPDPAKAEQYNRWRELRRLQIENEKKSASPQPASN